MLSWGKFGQRKTGIARMAEQPSTPTLEIQLFGSFAVNVEGMPLPRLRTRKGQSLLALLALRSGRDVEREWLAGTLWPESTQQQALANLRLSLTDLRQSLGSQAYRLQSPSARTLRLDTSGAVVDVLAFDHAVKRGDAASLERAVSLYRGALLEDCLEEWALPEREARALAYLRALESLATVAAEVDDWDTAAHHLRLVLARDPLRETAQQALMTALARAGNYAAAVLSYRGFRLQMREEMGTEPDAETRAVFEQVRAEARSRARVTIRPLPVTEPERGTTAISGGSISRNNLPHPQTSFVGRHRELDDIRRLLHPDTTGPSPRLVTLTGPGGNGKTRLALQVGETQQERYPDGVWLVELAPLSDGTLLTQVVASALGISEKVDMPLQETLESHLRSRSLLLILDNCEHLLVACAGLADWLLRRCPSVRILATSRELLRVAGEFAYRVPALGLPSTGETLSPEQAMEYEALRLFTERAVFRQPTFHLTIGNLPVVTQICRRLDGSPLAIELAAARMGALTVEQLAQRLDDRFKLLTEGNRAALPHQQTLRATIDWSYDLLEDAERRLLRRLSVFAGGCTLEAAEAICADEGEEYEILDRLASLVSKSLVVAEDSGAGKGMRYYLLETVRQYAHERLAESGENKSAQNRHIEWYLQFAEQANSHLWIERGWLDELESEHDNIRTALEYSRDRGDGREAGMRLAGPMAQFWYIRNFWTEGREWVEEMLREGHGRASIGHARALFGAGILAWIQDDYRKARPILEKSIALWNEIGDTLGYYESLIVLGPVLATLGDYKAGTAMLEECLDYFLPRGNYHSGVFCRAYLSRFALEQEDCATALRQSETCLEEARQADHQWGVAYARVIQASVAERQADYDRAEALCRESLEVSHNLGYQRGIAQCELVMALIASRKGLFSEAEQCFATCQEIFQELGDKVGLCETLEGRALLSALSGKREEAFDFLAQSERLRDAIGIPMPPSNRTLMDSWLKSVRSESRG